MAALDFPPSPVVGDKYPVTPVPGQPQYTWDGEKWTTTGAQVTSASPSNNLPLMDATPAVPGVGTQYSREDHVHPTDTSRAADTAVLKKVPQSLTVTEQTDVRKNLYAAPFDAMAYSGMQINGGFEVSQEIGGGGTTIHNKQAADGYYLHKVGTAAVLLQQVNSGLGVFPGMPYCLSMSVTTAQPSMGANDFVAISHYIEAWRCSRLAWGHATAAQPITIAFWTNHKRTGTYTGAVRNDDYTRGYAFSYTQNVADAVEYKTITIPGDVTGTWASVYGGTNVGMRISFVVAAGASASAALNTWSSNAQIAGAGQVNGVAATSDVFRIAGLVVLPGVESPTAARSPLIMRPYDQELLTCRRYFQQIGGASSYEVVGLGQAYANTNAQVNTFFDCPMRTGPTCTTTGNFAVQTAGAGAAATTGIVQIAATTTQSVMNITVATGLITGDSTKLMTNNDLNARIKFDARL